MNPSRDEEDTTPVPVADAARTRAAVEVYARHEPALRRTARRYSLCGDDADDALQRALEIVLRKAPTTDPRELIRWTQTVVKHEALAIRRDRERILSGPAAAPAEDGADWVSLIPADADGPAERAERREVIARSREALQALKPQELRALSLLAEGYSYIEIGQITGYSRTKINRCLAEGRERFRSLVARSEDGRRCGELGAKLSAFCDGEAGQAEVAEVREHLRACGHCRATLRAYRAAPAAAAALSPALPLDRSIFERAHDMLAGAAARFGGGGGGGDSALSQVAAAGGTRGAGMAALAKAMALCVGTVGGAAACVATGVVPAPLAIDGGRVEPPRHERRATLLATEPTIEAPVAEAPAPEPEPEPPSPAPDEKEVAPPEPEVAPATSSGAVEYAPEPEASPTAETAGTAGSSSGSAAGEFGP